MRPLTTLLAICLGVLIACTGTTQSPTPTTLSKPTAAAPSPAAVAASPAASPAVAVPSPSAQGATTAPSPGVAPSPSPAALPEVVWIGNTGGAGVYLRNSPHDGDRSVVLPEGTRVTITGEQVEGDGKLWHPITTANNEDGYVQIEYVTRVEPTNRTATPTGEPK